jgi:DNA repair ATPase RecN
VNLLKIKNNMKKIILLLLVFTGPFFSGQIKSQGAMVVTDPGSLAQILELVKTGAEQAKSINEQVNYLKEAKDAIETVSSYLKSARTVEKAIGQSKRTITVLNKLTNGISSFGNLNPAYVSGLTNQLKNYYSGVNDNVEEITDLLTDGKFKLNDAERMDLINEKLDNIHLIEIKARNAYMKAYGINNRLNVLK